MRINLVFTFCVGVRPIHSAVENNDLAAVKRQCIILKARRSSVNVLTSKEEVKDPFKIPLVHCTVNFSEC